jgi:hypothetical protein
LASVVQLVGQVASVPSHTNGVHDGLPALPEPSTVQVPFAVAPSATEHASQAPPHALLQQYPSTQVAPITQSSVTAHVEPTRARAVHCPWLLQ